MRGFDDGKGKLIGKSVFMICSGLGTRASEKERFLIMSNFCARQRFLELRKNENPIMGSEWEGEKRGNDSRKCGIRNDGRVRESRCNKNNATERGRGHLCFCERKEDKGERFGAVRV